MSLGVHVYNGVLEFMFMHMQFKAENTIILSSCLSCPSCILNCAAVVMPINQLGK